MNPGVLIIATKKYKHFVKPLLDQIEKYFLINHDLTVFIFTDEILELEKEYRFDIVQSNIPSYGWPEATLYRYKIFYEHRTVLRRCSHLCYMDVDMGIVAPIGDEVIVNGLLCVRHPGMYATDDWGSQNNPKQSASWFPEQFRKHYYCGGVQGGESVLYIQMCRVLSERISEDERNGVMAEWHDETHANKYWNYDRPELVTSLGPSYCMVEEPELRRRWGIDKFEPKIIALSKNHKEIRL